jgi:hypothetical protein
LLNRRRGISRKPDAIMVAWRVQTMIMVTG